MIRLLLVVIGWPLVVVALITAYQWQQAVAPRASEADIPALDPATAHPIAWRLSQEAVREFRALPPAEQEAIVASLAGRMMTPAHWVARARRADYDILCVGEMHEPDTRAFLAETLFSRYPADVLYLEARPLELARIEDRFRAGRRPVELLEADIGAVLARARGANPAVQVWPIEETAAQQQRRREGAEGSRDRSLARNFWSHYRAGGRHVVLAGALHCADERGWLYRHLRVQSARPGLRLHSVHVFGEHQLGPLAGFVHLLDAIGLRPGDFALVDAGSLHPRIREWFGLLHQQVFERSDSLIVFRTLDGREPRRDAPGAPRPRWIPVGSGT